MRYLLILSLFFAGCCRETLCPTCPEPIAMVRTDTVQVIIIRNDSLQAKVDSLKTELFLAKYKIEKVKYYLAIVRRNPSQQKFLRGWVIRAVE